MQQKIRVGIIGCGGISRVHRASLMAMDTVEITAVCDIRSERADAAAQETGAKAYYDYKELLGSGVEAVHLCTPHYLHAPMAIEALSRGIHVLTEKPMATTLEDARAMIAASEKPGAGILGVIFQNRYNESVREMKALMESGKTGAFLGAKASVTWRREKGYYVDSGWRGSKITEGGGTLINQSIHTMDLMSYLFGPIASVRGEAFTGLLADDIEVEDNVSAVCLYEGGQRALIHASNNFICDAPIVLEAHFENMVLRLSGDKLFRVEEDGEHMLTGGAKPSLAEKAYWGSGHKAQIADFYNSVAEGKAFWLNGREGFPALSLVRAILRSSQEHCWVNIEKV